MALSALGAPGIDGRAGEEADGGPALPSQKLP
jgi:hypothetical protein